MSRPECSIAGCEKESRGRGWCATHWGRWRTHGDPMTVHLPGRDYNVKVDTTCTVAECDRTSWSKGLCTMHYARARSNGDPTIVRSGGRPPKGEHPGWGAVHKRLRRAFGRAAQHSCVDCGGRAREWSYDNADPNELVGFHGRWPLRYSLDLSHYRPRCTPCHRRFDREAAAA